LGYRTIAFEKDEVDRLIDIIKKGDTTCHKTYPLESSSEKKDMKSIKSIVQDKVTKQSVYEKWLSPPRK